MVRCLLDIAAVRGNLPRLELLVIDGGRSSEAATKVMDFFAVAPRLRDVDFCGPPVTLLQLPLEQLNTLNYWIEIQELEGIILIMARLSAGVNLRVSFEDESDLHPLVADVPVVTSQVSSLRLDPLNAFGAERANQVFSHVIARLALPCLLSMHFVHFDYEEGVPLPWPHLAFTSLSRRSSFGAHLTSLDLHRVLITEAELVQTLSGLPLLE